MDNINNITLITIVTLAIASIVAAQAKNFIKNHKFKDISITASGTAVILYSISNIIKTGSIFTLLFIAGTQLTL